MINIIWAVMMMAGIFYMIITGNSERILESITSSSANAIQLCISLVSIYCFWLGIMNIANDAHINSKAAKMFSPVLKGLFPDASPQITELMSMNITSNILGLGNAATPYGLRAMQAMDVQNGQKDTPSHSMMLFVVINSSSLQLIPTTVLSLRHSYGANDPSSIVITTFISTLITAFTGIVLCKALSRIADKRI